MTREEIERLNVTEPYCCETDREEQWYQVGLIEGLRIADEHPKEGLVDIEKVIKWLQDNADSYTWYDEFEGESGMTDDFIEDLRKAMEE